MHLRRWPLLLAVGLVACGSSSSGSELTDARADDTQAEVPLCDAPGEHPLTATSSSSFIDSLLKAPLSQVPAYETEIACVRACGPELEGVVAALLSDLDREWTSSAEGVSHVAGFTRALVILEVLSDLESKSAASEAARRLRWTIPPQEDPLPSVGMTQHDQTVSLMLEAVRVITCGGELDKAAEIATSHPDASVREAATHRRGCRLRDL